MSTYLLLFIKMPTTLGTLYRHSHIRVLFYVEFLVFAGIRYGLVRRVLSCLRRVLSLHFMFRSGVRGRRRAVTQQPAGL